VQNEFKDFCLIERRLASGSANHYANTISRLLAYTKKKPDEITVKDIRQYLSLYKNGWSYANQLKALRLFFSGYLKNELMNDFVFPKRQFNFNHYLPSKEDLRNFIGSLESVDDRALFLFFASSGLRRNEVLGLQINDIELERRVCHPNHQSETKNAYFGFFNEECRVELKAWLEVKGVRSLRVFPISSERRYMPFKRARLKTGLEITPKVLRFWFANEMARLGVPDRFIDAFQGRIPRSVLARHYTDYSLENLKQIYDKAGLKVFEFN
jgi:integrase